jgi:signal transduction histidine kinase
LQKVQHYSGMSLPSFPLHADPKLSARRLGIIVFVAVAVALCAFYWFARSSLISAARLEVEQLAAVAAVQVDADRHPLLSSPSQAGSTLHRDLLAPLVKFHRATKDVMYVYTAILRDDNIFFVLGTDYEYRVESDDLPPDPIMHRYSGNDRDLRDALQQQRATSSAKPVQERYRNYLSAYAPIIDSRGQFVGVIGIDMWTRDLEQRLFKLNFGLAFLMALNLLFSLLLRRVYGALRLRADAQQRTQLELEQARDAGDRASSAAALASVVAHEFSQHLTVAGGFVELANNHANEQAAQHLENAQLALSRASDSVEQIRSLSADTFSTLDNVNLYELTMRAIERLRRRGFDVSRIILPAPARYLCMVDATRITATIGHLIRNALEANPRTPVTISFQLDPSELGWTAIFEKMALPKPAVAIIIGDSGIGIDEAKLKLLKRPFYSSKGAGYGLGFAVARGALQTTPGTLLVRRDGDKTLLALVLRFCPE